ncbi:hypothetical protein F4813DRAFT_354715 [Daldinia decipiens]|uniref:uncharacterized protein n=1 Tax=Daldinia decipiens TaxID=326647 RepID=UPI0020C53F0F|nr:uncharacterized protein F4813DRAFT_354715 [Daldinia decipiens]KAI1659344.1 hypothetical protein F4813DRAFT_354715 [Daldinia decipiens]
MTEERNGTGVVKPTLNLHHPVIQSVTRERHRHNAEMRRVRQELTRLETEQDRLWVENEQLKTLLNHLPDDNSLDQFVARIGELEKQNDALEDEVHKLQGLSPDDARELRADHFPTHARNSITRDDLALEYRNFVDEIINLIYQWVSPLLNDEKHAAEVIQTAVRDGTAKEFIGWMEAYPDIARLSSFNMSTEYVILAIVMRWIDNEIFEAEVCGIAPEILTALENIEDSLYHNVKPQPRPVEIRRWRQNTNYALLQHPEYKNTRDAHEKKLAGDLQHILRFLPGAGAAGAIDNIRNTMVFRALEINELFATSVDHFQLQAWEFLAGPNTVETTSAAELYEYREWFELEDPLDNANKVDIEDKSLEEATRRLDPVCAVIPAVVLRHAENPDDVTLCCKSYIVASWGLPKTRERKWNEQTASFLNELLSG